MKEQPLYLGTFKSKDGLNSNILPPRHLYKRHLEAIILKSRLLIAACLAVFKISEGPLPDPEEAGEMGREGHRPGDGIGDVDSRHAVQGRYMEQRRYPYEAQTADAEQRDDRLQHGISHSAHHAAHLLHQAADGVGGGDQLHALHTGCDDRLARGIDTQQRMAEYGGGEPQQTADKCAADKTTFSTLLTRSNLPAPIF